MLVGMPPRPSPCHAAAFLQGRPRPGPLRGRDALPAACVLLRGGTELRSAVGVGISSAALPPLCPQHIWQRLPDFTLWLQDGLQPFSFTLGAGEALPRGGGKKTTTTYSEETIFIFFFSQRKKKSNINIRV